MPELPDSQICLAHLTEIVKRLSLAQRVKVSSHIEFFEDLLGVQRSLVKDRRTGRSGRKKLHGGQNKVYQYWVEFRNAGSVGQMSLEDAARFVGLTPGSLRQYVSLRKQYSVIMEPPNLTGIEDIVVITRINADGTDRFTKEDKPYTHPLRPGWESKF